MNKHSFEPFRVWILEQKSNEQTWDILGQPFLFVSFDLWYKFFFLSKYEFQIWDL